MTNMNALYNQKRIDFKDNPKGVLDETLKEVTGQWSNLGHLASHLANCITNGIYPQNGAVYPLIDLESMVQLKERRVPLPKESLQAVYSLLDDYLLPERKQQKYKFTPYQAASIIQAAIDLGLGRDFDISYVERVIKQAETERYPGVLEGRRAISALVDKRVAIERAKRIK